LAAGEGLKVHLLEDVAPTPSSPMPSANWDFPVGRNHRQSQSPEYNGFKVYMEDGAQLVGPEQQELEESIASVHDWSGDPLLSAGR